MTKLQVRLLFCFVVLLGDFTDGARGQSRLVSGSVGVHRDEGAK